ncbi:MAG: tetratricopeptide repeat protein [Candidatus Obscuribacterales bacterium]|nr:tetratricopeptide repeat protein [Candidatus Obscuribacterales bacterium]
MRLRKRFSFLLIMPTLAGISFYSVTGSALANKKLELNPKTPQQDQACDLLMEGTRLLQAKKPFKARKVLEQSAHLWPESAGVHYNLGCCYNECALYDQAISEFKRALDLDPKMTDCLVNMGSCYQVQGRTDEAIAFFQGYLKKNAHSKDAETIQGMIRALEKYKREHVDSDPASADYLPSICDEGHVRRWQITRLPLAIYISNGTDQEGRQVQGFREEFNYILLGAINDWMKASHFKLSYRLVTDPKQADLACTWTHDPAFLHEEGNKVEQGVAQVFAEKQAGADGTKAIVSANVRILVCNRETGAPLSSDDMKKTCLHEIGHALGMVGHSPSNKDVMFYSNSSSVWPALTKRDKATILRIYQDFPELPQSSPAAPPNPQQYQ